MSYFLLKILIGETTCRQANVEQGKQNKNKHESPPPSRPPRPPISSPPPHPPPTPTPHRPSRASSITFPTHPTPPPAPSLPRPNLFAYAPPPPPQPLPQPTLPLPPPTSPFISHSSPPTPRQWMILIRLSILRRLAISPAACRLEPEEAVVAKVAVGGVEAAGAGEGRRSEQQRQR